MKLIRLTLATMNRRHWIITDLCVLGIYSKSSLLPDTLFLANYHLKTVGSLVYCLAGSPTKPVQEFKTEDKA
jgi:hypothetical protein